MSFQRAIVARGGVEIECLVRGHGRAVILIASLGRPADDFDHLAAALADAGSLAEFRATDLGDGRG